MPPIKTTEVGVLGDLSTLEPYAPAHAARWLKQADAIAVSEAREAAARLVTHLNSQDNPAPQRCEVCGERAALLAYRPASHRSPVAILCFAHGSAQGHAPISFARLLEATTGVLTELARWDALRTDRVKPHLWLVDRLMGRHDTPAGTLKA